MPRIVPCLLYLKDAEKAARFYVSVFPNSKITNVARYGGMGPSVGHGAKDVLTVDFTLDGHRFVALNGPEAQFSMATSFQVFCKTQKELDRYWKALSKGGDPKSQVCGWLKDRFGMWWQVVPDFMGRYIGKGDNPRADRVMKALMGMKKLDFAELKKAYAGKPA
jgi:predicted 3-demethylubiquinone-9 3-methyltransferase (glyoxalase superfamily)